MKDVAVATRCLPHSLRVRSLKTELKAGLFANFCPLRLQGDGGWVRKSVAFGRLSIGSHERTRRRTAGVI